MAVRSDFRQRGITTEMVRLGLADARKQGVPITLYTSVLEALLHSRLGVEGVGRCCVQMDGETMQYEVRGMVYGGTTKG